MVPMGTSLPSSSIVPPTNAPINGEEVLRTALDSDWKSSRHWQRSLAQTLASISVPQEVTMMSTGTLSNISLSLVCRLSLRFYRMLPQETLDTHSYFITEADKLNLAYFTLVRYHPPFDVEFDGTYFHPTDLSDSDSHRCHQVCTVQQSTTSPNPIAHTSTDPQFRYSTRR
jgi:hypothetical protein